MRLDTSAWWHDGFPGNRLMVATGGVLANAEVSAEHGIIRQTEYFGTQIAGKNLERYLKIQKDDCQGPCAAGRVGRQASE